MDQMFSGKLAYRLASQGIDPLTITSIIVSPFYSNRIGGRYNDSRLAFQNALPPGPKGVGVSVFRTFGNAVDTDTAVYRAKRIASGEPQPDLRCQRQKAGPSRPNESALHRESKPIACLTEADPGSAVPG
jgi:hypothetical protein